MNVNDGLKLLVLLRTRRNILKAAPALIAATFAAACGAGEIPAEVRTIDGVPNFPTFAYATEKSIAGYQAAIAHRDLVAWVPCYCGCGEDPRFKSLLDCFVTADNKWDAHASSCEICLDEALDVAKLHAESNTIVEIRGAIDAKYSRYGRPTDTPPLQTPAPTVE